MSVSYVGQSGVPASGTGAVTVAWPSGHQADDIGVLLIQHANQPISTLAGWNLIGSSGVGTAGVAGSVGVTAFWKRAASGAEADVSLADLGDHQRARILAFRGCETSGSPINTAVLGIDAVSETAVSIPAITTTVDGCMVLAGVANATDTTASQTTVGSWANATFVDPTYINYGNTTSGVGGGINAYAGTVPSAGSSGTTTSTLATASLQANFAIALKPPGAPPVETVTNGGLYVATGTKETAGVVSATAATLDAAAVQARLTFALKTASAPANSPPVIAAVPAIQGAVGLLVSFPVVATDPDGDAIVLSLVDGDTTVPTGAALVEDESSGNFVFNWTPTADQAGQWDFFVQASDGTDTSVAVVSIVVVAAPDTTLRDLARSLADRARTDAESLRALADLMDEKDQMNADVIHKVRTIVADALVSEAYMNSIIEELDADADGSN